MKQISSIVGVLCILFCLSSCLANTEQIISPNKKINLRIESKNKDEQGYGQFYFVVEYAEEGVTKTIFSEVDLGLKTDLRDLSTALKLISSSEVKNIKDDYIMVTGKRSHCINEGLEKTFRFENKEKQPIDITFRVYNDGVAFNYSVESLNNKKEQITEELTSYHIPEGTNRWIQKNTIDYENFYPLQTSGKSTDNEKYLWEYPALVEPQDSIFTLITEADLRKGHSASRLSNAKDFNIYQVCSTDEKVGFEGKWTSAWRLLIIGSLADIVESTLVTDVSAPSIVKDTDWIIPGKASWIYWAHNHGSKDYQIVKEYIDLAKEMKWEYNLIDWEWDVMTNGGDVIKAIEYAKEKDIKTLLWYNSGTQWIGPGAPGPLDRLNKKEDREVEYAKLVDMGVSGIKIDFFAPDGVDITNYYIDLLEDAAKYKLLINFHGATIPRGWQRTYPNMMTVEAVYGAEWYNNRPILTDRAVQHNATLPFTRNVIGPMDYTPGTFTDSQYPHSTSHGHELALYVLFESALQHMPDRPSSYMSLPETVKNFLTELPTTWDDTKLLDGYPGEDVIIARRKGDSWYIAGVNGTNEAQELILNLSKWDLKDKKITIIKDGVDNRSFSIEEPISISDTNSNFKISCQPRGGFVAKIE